MKIQIEKETKFSGHEMKEKVRYYLWIDRNIAYSADTEEAIHERLEQIKANYVAKSEIVYEEEFNVG